MAARWGMDSRWASRSTPLSRPLPSPVDSSWRPSLPLYLAPKPRNRKIPKTAAAFYRDSVPSHWLRAQECLLNTPFKGLFPEAAEQGLWT